MSNETSYYETAFVTGDDTIAMGRIEKVVDGVAWGTFDDGMTFDLPVNPLYHVPGNMVRMDATNPDETGSEYVMMIIGQHHATLLWCDNTEEGLQIMDSEVIAKTPEKAN